MQPVLQDRIVVSRVTALAVIDPERDIRPVPDGIAKGFQPAERGLFSLRFGEPGRHGLAASGAPDFDDLARHAAGSGEGVAGAKQHSQICLLLRQLVLDQPPYGVVIDRGIAMHENISKGDNAAQFGDVARDLRIDVSKVGKRLADDLKSSTAERSRSSSTKVSRVSRRTRLELTPPRSACPRYSTGHHAA